MSRIYLSFSCYLLLYISNFWWVYEYFALVPSGYHLVLLWFIFLSFLCPTKFFSQVCATCLPNLEVLFPQELLHYYIAAAMPTIEKFCGEGITEDMIKDSATLFSNNYGVWSKAAASKMGRNLVEGSRIKISPKLLRQKCIPDGADNIYVRFIDNSP